MQCVAPSLQPTIALPLDLDSPDSHRGGQTRPPVDREGGIRKAGFQDGPAVTGYHSHLAQVGLTGCK